MHLIPYGKKKPVYLRSLKLLPFFTLEQFFWLISVSTSLIFSAYALDVLSTILFVGRKDMINVFPTLDPS